MGIFNFLEETVVNIVKTPFAVVHDVVTLGGMLNDSECQTAKVIENEIDSITTLLDK